jgi:hypothetical protein
MRYLIVAAAALATCALLGACAGYRFPGGPPPGTGMVSGQVTVVPCAPVEKADARCQGKPASSIALIFTSSSHEQVVAQTDSAGNYSVELKAGKWAVAIKGYMRVISGPSTVTVEAGGSVVANYVVDSGIRVPVPVPAPAAGSVNPPSD